MTRARLCLFLFPIFSSACQKVGSSSSTDPTDASKPVAGDDARQLASGDGLPIVAVPQRLPSIDPYGWHFDPSGRLIAEQFTDDESGETGCGIWDIESGTFVRAYMYTGDEDESTPDPCYDWSTDARAPSDTSADGKLRASVIAGLEIEVIGGASRTVRGCASCDFAMAWAPSGHLLATSNGALLEIWDADTGKRLRSETLGLGDAIEIALGWTDEGIGLVVLHRISAPCSELEPEGNYCDYEAYDENDEPLDAAQPMDGVALSSFWWPADGKPPIAKLEQYKGVEEPNYHVDAGARWIAFNDAVYFDRDGTSTTMYVLGVGERSSALGWTESDSDNEDWIERWDGRWRVDVATQWIEGVIITSGGDEWYAALELGWDAIVAEPNPGVWHGQVATMEGGSPSGEIDVWAASSGAAVSSWEACVDDEEHEEPSCKSGRPPAGDDCGLLDVSPSLSLALVECDAGLRLIEATGRGATVSELIPDGSALWRWGRGNYLALLDGAGEVAVFDLATGKPLYRRSDVIELLEVPLAAEQDRLALLSSDHLEIVEGSTGARVIDVPGEWLAAALSPDGKQLATLGGQQLHVIEIASGTTSASVPVDDALRVAWRQDGAALFYGYDWPTHAIDPKTGALLYEVSHPLLDMMDLWELDPSWRWIHRPDGSITRTLDFQRIELGPTWARLDSGAFEGELRDLPENLRFRVGDDANAAAIYTVADLEPWLRTPGLMQAFFSGKPLPSPRVPAEALTKLPKHVEGQR